jgi:hypothetical protein
MKQANGHVKFKNSYNRVHVHVTGNCMEWRQDQTSQGGGYLSTDVFVDIAEQTWHANLNVVNAFAPVLFLLLCIQNATGLSVCVERQFSCAAV